jgi:Protein of unknown function (DUF2950)
MNAASITRSFGILMFLCCASFAFAQDGPQKTFANPDDAVVALVNAAKVGNTDELLTIFGSEGQKILSSGDPVMDRRDREVFLVAYSERAALKTVDSTHRLLYVGYEDWPFPVPLIKEGQAWRFDTSAGSQEILYRRVGANELNTIRVCEVFVEAQQDYAATAHDDKPASLYAQKFSSTPGKQDGLYWKSDDPDDLSPLGELAAEAASDGYRSADAGQPTPFQGYFFRILTSQGKAANRGARSYIVDGEMRNGFAMIAFPAAYGASGVMTFIVNQDGVVYQKDLGSDTAKLAAEISQFDPDSGWTKVK